MRPTSVLFAAIALLFVACGVERGPAPATNPDGYAAPDFTVDTLEGEEFRLGEHKGTPVVINFWESW